MTTVAENLNKRNGKVEVFRFIFAMGVIFFHLGVHVCGKEELWGLSFLKMKRGYVGVEFFFLISGFMMAKTIEKIKGSLSTTYIPFLWGKVRSLLPYHLIAFAVLWLLEGIYHWEGLKKFIKVSLEHIPNLFFLQKAGFNFVNINPYEWYISAMLLAIAIIYPLCRKNHKVYTRVVAPLIAIVIYGWLIHDYKTVSNVNAWDIFGYRCVWRAIAGMSLGMFAYEGSKVLSKENWSKKEQIFFTLLENVCWIFSVVYVCTEMKSKYEIYVIFMLFIAIMISFSKEMSLGRKLFQNRIAMFLGRMSLSLYLIQDLGIEVVNNSFGNCDLAVKMILAIVIDFVAALLLLWLGDWWMKRIRNSHIDRILSGDIVAVKENR